MMFSIITICFNEENRILATLQSVLSQRFPDFEYIVIDGCSADETCNIVTRYAEKDSRITFVSKKDTGIYNAMNKGIAMAKGEYLNFMNAGDYYYNDNVLSEINKTLESNSETDVLIGKVMIDGKVCYIGIDEDDKSIYYGYFFPHQATFSRRTIYEKIGEFDENYRICADYDWVLKAYDRGYRLNWCEQIVAYYDSQGISSTIDGIVEQYNISKKYFRLSEKSGDIKNLEEYYLNMFRLVLFRNLLKSGSDLMITKVLHEKFETGEIDIWGAGTIGCRLYDFFVSNGIKVNTILDSNKDRIGMRIGNTVISGTNSFSSNMIIISTEIFEKEIQHELEERGMICGNDFMTYSQISSQILLLLFRQGYYNNSIINLVDIDFWGYLSEISSM